MTPEETLRLALLEDRFPEDVETDRFFTPSGEDKLRMNRNIALSAWMSRTTGRDINAGSITWQADKDAIAQGFFKIPTASKVSDEQFHNLVRSHVKTSDEAADLAARYALQGKGLVEAMSELESKRGPSQLRGIWDKYSSDLAKRHTVLTNKLAPYRPLIRQISSELSKEMEWAVPTTDTFQRVADKLMQVPEGDRRLVLSAIGATGGMDAKERSSYLSKLAGAMGRMTETMGSAVASSVAEAAMPGTIADLVEAGQMEMAGRMEKESERQRQMTLLTQQIRSVADQEISPIKEDGWWKGLGIDLARMIPQSAVSVVNPALGFGANWAYFKDTVAAQAMMEDPALSVEQAEGIANATAPLNAAVETVTALIPFGKVRLPFLQKWIQATTTSLGGAARNLAIRSAAGTASEIGEEWMQSYLPLKAQELAAALSQDVPGVDWEKRMPKFSEIAAQTWGPALVFSLVGGGAASISEVRSGRDLAQDVDAMVATGMNPDIAAKIAEAAKANDWQATDALFREEFVSDKKATEEERKGAFARFQQKQEEMRRIQARDTAEAEAIGVAVIRDAEGWKVRMSDGSVIPADSAEAATRMQKDMAMAASEYEAETMVAAVDEMLAQQPGRRFEVTAEVAQAGDNGLVFTNPITGQVREIKDEASLQNLRDEQMALAKKEGEEPAAALILGMNRFEFGNGIISVFQRGLNKDGTADVPRIITAMHEQIEASWRKGVVTGQFSEAESRAAVANLMSQLDVAKLGKAATDQEKAWFERAATVARGEGDENLLREVISELAVRTWIGRDKVGEKTGLRPGTVLRALDAAVLKAKQPAEMSMMKRLRAWIKAVGAYLRGVVATAKLISQAEQAGTVTDYTEFMDKLLGLTESRREDMAQADQIKQQMEDDGMAFSLAPTTAQDAEYLAAVQAGDTEKAQSMVDNVAKATGFNIGPVYHGSIAGEVPMTFDKRDISFFTTNKETAKVYAGMAGKVGRFYIQASKLLDAYEPKDILKLLPRELRDRHKSAVYSWEVLKDKDLPDLYEDSDVIEFLSDAGYDGLRIHDDVVTKNGRLERHDTPSIAIFNSSQIKSADPVTYDDAGNVIPLSQRFQPESADIRFSLSPTSSADQLAQIIESIMQSRPDLAFKIRQRSLADINRLIQNWSAERVTWKGDKVRPVVEKRTKLSLDKEQAMREAVRYAELLDSGMATLTPETLMAWSEGVGKLEQHPLIRQMLGAHGRLMSKSTAESLGKLKTDGKGKAGDYDGAGWLPPQWYSGSAGGIMPDVMAQNLYDDGLLNEPTPDALWQALDSVITTHRAAKAEYAKAEMAVKSVENQAKEKAKAESAAWREETEDMMADDWSPRESLQRDARLFNTAMAAFPAEIRAKIVPGGMVKLAGLATERARYKVIEKAMQKAVVELEKFMRKEQLAEVVKLLDKSGPVGAPGEVKKSRYIVTVQDELDAISEVVGMDVDEVQTQLAETEAALIAAQTPEDADTALTRLNLLETFGGILDIKNTTSVELDTARQYLEGLMAQGRAARRILDEARREAVKAMVEAASKDAFKGVTGPETTQEAKKKRAKASGKAMLKKFFNELSGFDGVLRDAFGPNSETATKFSERFTLNSNNFEDTQNERRKRLRDFARDLYRTRLGAVINQKLIKLEQIESASGVTYLKGREVKTHKFTVDDALKIVADPKAFGFTDAQAQEISDEIQAVQMAGGRRTSFTYEQEISKGDRVEIPLSQMNGIYLSMALRQPGILEQQQRYGYDQQTVDELESFLTDDAKRWREWMQGEYDAEYARANAVYMRMFNTRMPRIQFYAPLLKNHQGTQATLDPLNTGMVAQSANPGSLKTRKSRTSSIRIESALSVFWAHFNQMDYWVTHAEYLRDVQAVMLNPKVRESVVSAHGEEGMQTISAWASLQMARGVSKGALAVAGSRMFRNVKSAVSMKALALNLGTALKTIPSVLYSLGEIHLSKWPAALASGVKHWSRLWDTNIIQRRLDIGGMPELRDLGSSALPMSWVNQAIRYGSYPTMYADGVLTTFSAAMAYGVNYDAAIEQGATEDAAHEYAKERTALIVSKTAQPENWTQKSLFENDASGAGALFFMFTSDPRQKLALAGEALNNWRKGKATTEEAMRKFLAYWVIPGVMFQLANAIGRSLFKGDDDEWEVVDFSTAGIVGQLQGLALLGSAAEMIVAAAVAAGAEKITGEEVKRKPFWNSPKNPLDQAAQEIVKASESLDLEDGQDGLEKAWQLTKAGGMLISPFTPAGALPSTAERVMKDTTNLFYREE